MKKLIIFMAAMLVLLILTGCSESLDEVQVEFCQALVKYGRAVDELQNISADTTVDELNSARGNVMEARQAMLDAAGDLRQTQIQQAEDAWENAQNEIENIPGDVTLEEAAAAIRGQALILATEIERARNINCLRR